jgi:hypothetical protein
VADETSAESEPSAESAAAEEVVEPAAEAPLAVADASFSRNTQRLVVLGLVMALVVAIGGAVFELVLSL